MRIWHFARRVSGSISAVAFGLMAVVGSVYAQPPLANLPGQVDVSSSGAANYSIPLTVPKGTAGMEPALSLEYSSQSQNGQMGWGWTLAGLPSIERCAANLAQDGFKAGVSYNANDRFCLNGERLVAISGTYGANNTEYRTERESFSKVVSYNTAGSGPQWFRVWTKAGQIMELGNSADSRLMAGTSVHAWHVNRMADTAGNYLTVTYTNDAANTQIYPNRIDYTGNSGLAPYNSVRFEYNTSRPDSVPTYHAGFLMKTTVLLDKIKTYEGNNLVSDYRITYTLGNNVRSSRIQSIALCNSAGGCLPATTFSWAPYADPISFTTTNWSSSIHPGAFTGDFNGDGLPDFFENTWTDAASYGEASFLMSTGPSNWQRQAKQIQFNPPPQVNGNYRLIELWLLPQLMELNGDGYTDALIYNEGRYENIDYPYDQIPYSPILSSVNLNDKTGVLTLAQLGTGGTWPNAQYFGDFNGDSRDDQLVLRPSPNGAIAYVSNGDGTFSGGAPLPIYSDSTVFVGDFDGNGCMDGLVQGAANKIYFTCNPAVAEVSVTNWLSGNHKLVLGDYNGDGKTDVLVTHSTNATSLMLSTGTGLVSAGYTGPTGWAKYQIHSGDFNGDGRSDVALIAANASGGNSGSPTPHAVYLSTGSGFVSSTTIANPAGNKDAHVHDFNGDGYADIWIYNNATFTSVQYTTNVQPMFITAIDNGLGAVTSIAYDRLNKGSSVYTKGTTATYPEMDLIGSQYVVTQLQLPNGIGGTNSYAYKYSGARRHQQGREFLGFKERIITDNQTGIVTTTTYRQDYPFIGRIATEAQVLSGITLQSSTHTYAADTLTPAGTGGQRRFVKLTQTVETARDLNGASFPTMTTNYNAYDSYGNPTTIVVSGSGGDTKTTTNVYSNNVTSWLLGRLTSTTTVHALTGQPSVTRKATFQYNATTGLMSQEVVEPDTAALRLTTDYGRDSYGNITTITVSGTDITSRVTTLGYDAKGRFNTTMTNPLSQTETYAYHPGLGEITQFTDRNSLSSSYLHSGYGHVVRVTDPDGRYRTISYAYCSGVAGGTASCPTNGAFQMETTPWRADGVTQSGAKSKVFYDRLSRVIAEDVEGVGGAWIRTAYEYDTLGRLRRSSRPYFVSGGTPQWTTRTFDALDRVTQEVYPDSSDTLFSYNGLTVTSTNDKNQTRTTLHDSQLQVYRVTEAGVAMAEYLYTAAGDMRVIKDPANNTITHTIDTRGRVTQSADPSRGTWTYQYNVLDQLKQQADAKSQVTTLTYDKLNRVTQVSAPAHTSTFTWDTATKGVGQLAMMETGAGNRRTHTYDSLGRPVTTTLRIDSVNNTFTSTYDPDGRLYTVQYPSGYMARYEYTANQRYPQYLRDHVGGGAVWTANSRNAEGQYTQATLGNGIVVTRNISAQTGRISAIQAGVANTVANLSFGYDTLGNLTSRGDANQSLSETFQYDSLNRLTQATIGATTRTVSYNSVGNITGKTRLGATTTNTYTYPAAGSTKPYAVSSITGVVNGVTNPSYSYDDNGNLVSGAGRNLTWTSFDKVSTITEGATSVAYTYDAEQQRLKQTVGATTVKYLNDPISGVSAEQHSVSGGTWHDYLFIDGQRIGMRMQTTSPAAVSWQVYVQDHQGSVAVVTDAVGAVVQRLSYDAWGRRRQPNGTEDPSGAITAPTSRGYTDHEHIPGVDLINMNGRVYDPEIARMVSADPLIPELFNTQALNRYSYVYNNPGTFTDPSGYCIDGVSTLACKVIISSAIASIGNFLFGKDEDKKKSAPPPHHAPGLATANEDLRQAEPLRDVSVAESDTLLNAGVAAATLAGGKTSLGGAKFLNGAESEAFDYASQDDGPSLGDKAHLVLGTISIGLDATGIGAAVSWVPDLIDAGVSVAQRDMAGAGMSVGAMIPGIGNVANAAKIGKVAAKTTGAVFRTTKEAAVAAEKMGFRKVSDRIHGQAVFTNGKKFITRDVDGHNGGAWKVADSIEGLAKKETRTGTYSPDLSTRVGD